MLIFIAIIVVAMWFSIGGVASSVEKNQSDFLADAVRRSAVQCYALEGRFPPDLKYLEDNYSLVIDRQRYAVYYEPMASNLVPQIRVLVLPQN
jgi:hypothetical protein